MEDGTLREVNEGGTPQGGIISPLLANIYLHYALDLWVVFMEEEQAARRDVLRALRNDFVMGFQSEQDVRAMRAGAGRGARPFGHVRIGATPRQDARDSSALCRQGRRPQGNGRRGNRDVRLPRLHAHTARRRRTGASGCSARPISKRMRAKLAAGQRPTAGGAGISPSRNRADRWQAWCEGTSPTTPCPATAQPSGPSATRRCDTGSGRCGAAASDTRLTWKRMDRLAARWLPPARILHPFPTRALRRHAPKAGAQCGSPARWDLRGGPPARAVPTAIAVVR